MDNNMNSQADTQPIWFKKSNRIVDMIGSNGKGRWQQQPFYYGFIQPICINKVIVYKLPAGVI